MKRLLILTILCSFIIYLSGCAQKSAAPIFYPPEPAAPRIQHLKTFVNQDAFRSDIFKAIAGAEAGYKLGRAFGVAFGSGKLYVIDSSKKSPGVTVFDLTNKKVTQLYGPLKKPLDIAIDDRGYKYVTDVVLKKIVVFNENDKYLKTLSLDGDFQPIGISAYKDFLYVANMHAGKIRLINKKDGSTIQDVPNKETMFWPSKAVIDETNGKIIAVQTGGAVVTEIAMDGDLLGSFGKPGDRPGNFNRPKSLAVDKTGNIYVVDVAFQNVQIFDKNSNVLMAFSGPRRGTKGLVMPAGIAIDYKQENIDYFKQFADPDFSIEYLIAVTSQGSPSPSSLTYSSVDVFGFGTKKGHDYSTSQIQE